MSKQKRFLDVFGFGLLVAIVSFSVAPVRAAGVTITVNTVDNVLGDGLCSFPEAALSSSNLPGFDACPRGSINNADTDIILFNIPGPGQKKIELTQIAQFIGPTTIDGSSQPGFAGIPLIHVTGSDLEDLLRFAEFAHGSTLKSMRLTNTNVDPKAIDRAGALFLTNGNKIVGNYFNVNADASSVVGSKGAGLLFGSEGGDNNVIGGTTSAERNIFGGQVGVYLQECKSNVIEGNHFGVQQDGVTPIAAMGVDGSAVQIFTIGLEPSTDNVVRNNVIVGYSAGVNLSQGTQGNTISGNYIGVGSDGATAIPNGNGILLSGSSGNTIGGLNAEARNIIAGNVANNIYVANHPTNAAWRSDNNLIHGNFVGAKKDGLAGVTPAAVYGVQMVSGSNNAIGGTMAGSGNLISGNAEGILISPGALNTIIQNNQVGSDVSGASGLPNNVGIRLKGGTATIAGNRISFNTTVGVFLEDLSGSSASVAANSEKNCISGNGKLSAVGSYGVNNTSSQIDFRNNWWGSADGPAGIGSGSGDWVSANVTYEPYLTESPPCPEYFEEPPTPTPPAGNAGIYFFTILGGESE